MHFSRVARALSAGALGIILLAGCAVNERIDAGFSPQPGAPLLDGTLNATGASSQVAAQEAWMAGFQTANPYVTVNYEPTGSGTGRADFQVGANSFAGSDRAFSDDEIAEADFQACLTDGIIEVPLYISPIAVAFHLPGITRLNLAPDTLAGIFAGTITRWNDAAIAGDNPSVVLPALAVSPVHRSDPSGTQETFTHYLDRTAPDVWHHGVSDTWPLTGGEAAQGTSGIRQALVAGQGTIGFLDASLARGLGQARLLVAGEFVEYSPEAAAALVENSPLREGRGPGDLVFDVDPAAAPAGTYPLALVSYLIGCEVYADARDANLVRGYLSYMASAEGQAAASANAGNSPISEGLRQKVLAAIDLIRVGTEDT